MDWFTSCCGFKKNKPVAASPHQPAGVHIYHHRCLFVNLLSNMKSSCYLRRFLTHTCVVFLVGFIFWMSEEIWEDCFCSDSMFGIQKIVLKVKLHSCVLVNWCSSKALNPCFGNRSSPWSAGCVPVLSGWIPHWEFRTVSSQEVLIYIRIIPQWYVSWCLLNCANILAKNDKSLRGIRFEYSGLCGLSYLFIFFIF